MLLEGSTFAAYEVRRRIAVGGMGEVYLCRHRLLDRLDAVKVLRPHLASDVEFRRRFLREALSAARLRHPNVVSVYTADEADGLLFLAMEYVAADDLATVLTRTGALDLERVVGLLRGVADALDAAHRAQLVHRDIKPSNLLVTDVGTPEEALTLVDFGISRILDADTEITRTGQIVGTIAYCAPEQLSQAPVEGAADQYALGCVAYECLSGQVPFPRESQLAIMTAHLTAPPPPVRALRPDLPQAVDTVLARAMAKDPRDRYPSCAEFVTALAEAVPRTDFPDPDALIELVRRHEPVLSHEPANGIRRRSTSLRMRVGATRTASDVTEDTAMVVDFAAGPYAVRGEPARTAALVRWLVAQTLARHRDREVCLVCAIEPDGDERWLWLNWLPHARPANPPVTGPHVATTVETAGDLLARLGAVVAERRTNPTAGPLVLAVLDARLGVAPDDPMLAGAARLGVHVIHLLAHTDKPPANLSTLDLSDGAVVWRRPGRPPATGAPDGVSATYVRALLDLLPD